MSSKKEKSLDDGINTKATVDTSLAHVESVFQPHFVQKERTHFRALLVQNPNYFGNLKESAFKAVLNIQGNTFYEEIGCVGFQPQFNRLDAVVFVKQPSGYGGDICSTGSQEYVRFYLSFDNGATWVDQGMTSFTAYNIPAGTVGPKRLEYAVSIPCKPPKKSCRSSNVILARAILAWNDPPPENAPDFKPVWGDKHDTHLQVDPRRFKVVDIFEAAKIKISPDIMKLIDIEQTIQTAESQPVGLAELHALYKGKSVEPHRYAMAHVQQMIETPAFAGSFKSSAFPGVLAGLDLDIGDIVGKLLNPDGSTFYEEMECVGYDPIRSELIATLRVKRPNGYSGGPCTDGSREYVTFWGDFNNNGTFETCLGTASVKVFDLDVPADGLEYSVFLPVNFNHYRRPCTEGPRLVPIRAILSWNAIPPCGNPNHVPHWGNREETLIHIYPGNVVVPGDFRPILFDVSLQAVCNIDQATGWATGDRPFGGNLCITGDIPAALDVAPNRIKYKVFVRDLPNLVWQPLGNNFGITIDESVGGVVNSFGLTQSVDGLGYYTFREYHVDGANWRRVSSPNRLLALWQTGLGMTGMWEIKIEALDTVTNLTYVAQIKNCADGTTRQNVKVRLDQDTPVPHVAITGFSTDGGVTYSPAINCATFEKGVWIKGTYSVSDAHFGSLALTVEPASAANGATVNPSGRAYPVVPTGGEAGTWILDTSLMDPCGFVVRLDAYDRTIVGCGGGPRHDFDTVGFCLKAPE